MSWTYSQVLYELIADAEAYIGWWVSESHFEGMDRDEQLHNTDLCSLLPVEAAVSMTDAHTRLTHALQLLEDDPLSRIHRIMDGVEWSADTLDDIAEVLTEYAHFEIADSGDGVAA